MYNSYLGSGYELIIRLWKQKKDYFLKSCADTLKGNEFGSCVASH